MKTERTKPGFFSKHRQIRTVLIILLYVTLFMLGWFIVVRLISPLTVVRTITLQDESVPASANSEPFSVLRVGCYNIAHGRGGRLGTASWNGGGNDKKKDRIKQIADLLRDEQLDIVVLNEVDFSSYWSGHINQAELIAKEAGYPYRVEQRNVDIALPFISLRFGNVILSKFPITNTVFLDFPHPSLLEEILYGGLKEGVAATIKLSDNSQVQVVAVHLSLEGESFRLASVQQILDLQRQSSLPMIAMGDFNTSASGDSRYRTDSKGQNSIDTLMASGQLTTIPRSLPVHQKDLTFPSEKPESIIDWIFVSPHWDINNKTVILTDLSDHLTVTAVLTKVSPE